MKVWLGVSAQSVKDRSLRNWWCVPKTAAVNDILLIYEKMKGIARVERVQSLPSVRERRCSEVGLATVDTTLIMDLTTPITARQLRSDKLLRKLPAVRRNFQGTCFRVPEELWPRLKSVIGLK